MIAGLLLALALVLHLFLRPSAAAVGYAPPTIASFATPAPGHIQGHGESAESGASPLGSVAGAGTGLAQGAPLAGGQTGGKAEQLVAGEHPLDRLSVPQAVSILATHGRWWSMLIGCTPAPHRPPNRPLEPTPAGTALRH